MKGRRGRSREKNKTEGKKRGWSKGKREGREVKEERKGKGGMGKSMRLGKGRQIQGTADPGPGIFVFFVCLFVFEC